MHTEHTLKPVKQHNDMWFYRPCCCRKTLISEGSLATSLTAGSSMEHTPFFSHLNSITQCCIIVLFFVLSFALHILAKPAIRQTENKSMPKCGTTTFIMLSRSDLHWTTRKILRESPLIYLIKSQIIWTLSLHLLANQQFLYYSQPVWTQESQRREIMKGQLTFRTFCNISIHIGDIMLK